MPISTNERKEFTDNLAEEEKLFVDCQSKARARLFSFLRAFVHQLGLTDERNVIIVVSDAKRSTIHSSTADVSATLKVDAKAPSLQAFWYYKSNTYVFLFIPFLSHHEYLKNIYIESLKLFKVSNYNFHS